MMYAIVTDETKHTQINPPDDYFDDYNDWHDTHFEPVTDAEINDMVRQHESRDWTLEREFNHPTGSPFKISHMNGQTLISVADTIIGRIWTKQDDDVSTLYWTHSEADVSYGNRQSWTSQGDCISDLVNRYKARQAKRELVQLHDGSWVYATNQEAAEFISWLSERRDGGY